MSLILLQTLLPLLFFFAVGYSKSHYSVDVDVTSPTAVKPMPDIYWQSCGFTPATDILTANGTENMCTQLIFVSIYLFTFCHYLLLSYVVAWTDSSPRCQLRAYSLLNRFGDCSQPNTSQERHKQQHRILDVQFHAVGHRHANSS